MTMNDTTHKNTTKPAVAFNVDKFKVALANAEAAGTARQDMYRAAVQAIDTINDVLGPKRTGRLKVSYVTTTDYKNHVVLVFSWEPVEDVSDWFRVCALPMPMDTRPWVTKSYPLDVIAIQNENTTVLVENRNNCTDLVEAVINSEPFMTWLAQHTLGTA
jgi:predicted secreted hydrolase